MVCGLTIELAGTPFGGAAVVHPGRYPVFIAHAIGHDLLEHRAYRQKRCWCSALGVRHHLVEQRRWFSSSGYLRFTQGPLAAAERTEDALLQGLASGSTSDASVIVPSGVHIARARPLGQVVATQQQVAAGLTACRHAQVAALRVAGERQHAAIFGVGSRREGSRRRTSGGGCGGATVGRSQPR